MIFVSEVLGRERAVGMRWKCRICVERFSIAATRAAVAVKELHRDCKSAPSKENCLLGFVVHFDRAWVVPWIRVQQLLAVVGRLLHVKV